MKDYKAIYEEWLSNPYFDQETKEELRAIRADEKEIKERFYMDLEFGTAGLRGVIGAGINRMNIYTVRRATQGLADYILEQGGAERGVAIAYDSRRMSPEFSDEAARTLAANGIKAYKFESLRPTPELSFAVRELGCIAGINITASHNPADYNGYKVAPIPDLPDRKTICIMERGNEKCQPKNENTQRRRVTMRPSRRGQCGWSPSRGGPAGRWPRNSASASTRCAAG